MTTQIKGYPFEVLSADQTSAVLADQVKSLDWRAQKAKKKARADEEMCSEVIAKLSALIL
jgi:mRNA interferase MazF